MESTSLTFTLQPGQPQFLCASEVQFLHCTQGALQLEWEQAGIPYQHVLHGGGMPWQPLSVACACAARPLKPKLEAIEQAL